MDAPIKSMPQSIDAEQNVLGAMIIDKTSIAEAVEVLKSEDFYKDSHKIIFSGIIELYQKDIAVDMLTLTENLKSRDKLEAVGGVTYITELCNSIVSTAISF